MNIAVLMGGISPERNVSLSSGKAVAEALRSKGHHVIAIDPARGADCRIDDHNVLIPNTPPTAEELASYSTRKLLECVSSGAFDGVDVAFSVLHGKYGEDGMMQALLDAQGVAYTGSGMRASALAMDKLQSKIMFQAAGIQTPPYVRIRANEIIDMDLLRELQREFRGGMVVKPNDQGSTVGMTIIESGHTDDIEQAIRHALEFSDIALIETYIPGRELTVAVIGNEEGIPIALPIVEIAPDGGFYDYEHKYTKGMSMYECPAQIDRDETEFIQELAVRAHRVLGCEGYSRVDFRLDEDFAPWCLEVNTLPGMTATSLVPKAAAAAGMDFAELCERIVELSVKKENHDERP